MMTPSRSLLDKEINYLKDNILRLTSMTLEALDQAMAALTNRNLVLAQKIVANDAQINFLRYELEQESLKILATQQPAAGDLRLVLAAIHITVELERIGDHAAGIAALVKRMQDEDVIESLHKLPKMSDRVAGMVRTTIEAFINGDERLARSVLDMDDKIDRQYRKLFRKTMVEMTDDAYIRRATYLLWIGHNIERIGDRATNIAERVIFMISGQYIEIDDYEPYDDDDIDDEDDE